MEAVGNSMLRITYFLKATITDSKGKKMQSERSLFAGSLPAGNNGQD